MLKSIFRSMLILLIAIQITGMVFAQNSGEVTVQLNWVFDSYWTGFYMAVDEGYYADQGLAVELVDVFDDEGEFIDIVDEVVSGRAQFGVVDTGTLLQARAEGIPVVAISSIFQRHPLAIASLAEKNIVTPQDLIGKTAHISSNSMSMFLALLAVYDIDPSDVNIVERTDFTTEPIVSGEADVMDAWVTFEITTLAVEGVEFNAIYPFEYGVDMYPDLIITSEDMIENHPEQIQNFLAATLKGIQVTVDDTDAATTHVLEWTTEDLISEEVSEALRRAVPLFAPFGDPPGMMNAELWEIGHEILLDSGILEEAIDLENAYTLEFLETIYGN